MTVKRKSISKKMRFEAFKRDSFKCQYCGKSSPGVILHADHINPVYEGGKNELTNLITSCEDCNFGKGKRKLSDTTTVEKQKAQLDDLNERRLQLEMMMKWREGLSDISETKLNYALEKWRELVIGYTINEHGIKTIKQYIKKYSIENILDAIELSTEQFLELDKDGSYTPDSVAKAFTYIGKICSSKKRDEEKPYLKDLYYVRGILKNRLSYIDLPKAFRLLESSYLLGATVDSLKAMAKDVSNWSSFREATESFISEQEQKRSR